VQTIDSCGAGDIHAGAFVHAFLEEWPLADSLAFAAAAAALKCTVAGNASAPESAEAVHEFLAQAQAR
jgi:sugar/nucleoside kinase (ribokinase family)